MSGWCEHLNCIALVMINCTTLITFYCPVLHGYSTLAAGTVVLLGYQLVPVHMVPLVVAPERGGKVQPVQLVLGGTKPPVPSMVFADAVSLLNVRPLSHPSSFLYSPSSPSSLTSPSPSCFSSVLQSAIVGSLKRSLPPFALGGFLTGSTASESIQIWSPTRGLDLTPFIDCDFPA
jgi:hypothetical protein